MTGLLAGSGGTGLLEGSRPGTGVSGGSPAPAVPPSLVASDLLEISATTPYTWDFSSYGPQEGDLCIIASKQGNGIAGAGGVSSEGWHELTNTDSQGRLLWKYLGANETTITFDTNPSYRTISFALFRGDCAIRNPVFGQMTGLAGWSRSTLAVIPPTRYLEAGSFRFVGAFGGSSTWTDPPGSATPTNATFEGIFANTGFFGSGQHIVLEGADANAGVTFNHGTTFSFDAGGSLYGFDIEIVPTSIAAPVALGFTSAANTANPQTITLPAHQAGDLLLIGTNNRNSGTNATAPAGWRRIAIVPGGNAALATTIFAKISDGTETTVQLGSISTGGGMYFAWVWTQAGLPDEDGQISPLDAFNLAGAQSNGVMSYDGSSTLSASIDPNPATVNDMMLFFGAAANDYTTAAWSGNRLGDYAPETTFSNDSAMYFAWYPGADPWAISVFSNGFGITYQGLLLKIPLGTIGPPAPPDPLPGTGITILNSKYVRGSNSNTYRITGWDSGVAPGSLLLSLSTPRDGTSPYTAPAEDSDDWKGLVQAALPDGMGTDLSSFARANLATSATAAAGTKAPATIPVWKIADGDENGGRELIGQYGNTFFGTQPRYYFLLQLDGVYLVDPIVMLSTWRFNSNPGPWTLPAEPAATVTPFSVELLIMQQRTQTAGSWSVPVTMLYSDSVNVEGQHQVELAYRVAGADGSLDAITYTPGAANQGQLTRIVIQAQP